MGNMSQNNKNNHTKFNNSYGNIPKLINTNESFKMNGDFNNLSTTNK